MIMEIIKENRKLVKHGESLHIGDIFECKNHFYIFTVCQFTSYGMDIETGELHNFAELTKCMEVFLCKATVHII